MISPSLDIGAELSDAVAEYHAHADVASLHARLSVITANASAASLLAAAEPYRGIPEVAGVLYDRIVELRPTDARSIVILANAYWLAGRGPDVVGELAARALAADPSNRAAWHLWALTEPSPRQRTVRWEQVAARFPDDDLARANLADNAASLAGAEHDPVALKLAISTYEDLLRRAEHEAQRDALERALATLRGWRL